MYFTHESFKANDTLAYPSEISKQWEVKVRPTEEMGHP